MVRLPIRAAVAILAPVAISSLLACARVEAPASLAITHVHVLPMPDEIVLPDQTVVVRNGRIVQMGSSDLVRPPRGATVVDGTGMYLLPSFVDTHVHLTDLGDLWTYLAYGVGAIRNLEGLPYHLFVREELTAGEREGPRLYTSGPYTNAPRIDTPEAATSDVSAQARAGYDCVKLHGEMTLEVLDAIGSAARSAGLPVVGHVPRDRKLIEVMEHGVMNEIAHAEEYLYTYFAHADTPWVERIPEAVQATAAAGVVVTPTLVTYRAIGRQVGDIEREFERIPFDAFSPFTKRHARPARNRYRKRFTPSDTSWLASNLELQKALVRSLYDAGVVLTTGTDANNPGAVPGFSLHDEIELLVDAGLTPFAALKAASHNGWRVLAGNEGPGVVAEGHPAELVLLEGNPLEDIRRTRRIAGIVSAGAWYSDEALQTALKELLDRYAAEQPFVDVLWDNTIEDGIALFRKARARDSTAFVFREDAMLCQIVNSIRDGAPETAVEGVRLLLTVYPESRLAHALLGEAYRDLREAGPARTAYATYERLTGSELVRRRMAMLDP